MTTIKPQYKLTLYSHSREDLETIKWLFFKVCNKADGYAENIYQINTNSDSIKSK
jgi:hypothetical protein